MTSATGGALDWVQRSRLVEQQRQADAAKEKGASFSIPPQQHMLTYNGDINPIGLEKIVFLSNQLLDFALTHRARRCRRRFEFCARLVHVICSVWHAHSARRRRTHRHK